MTDLTQGQINKTIGTAKALSGQEQWREHVRLAIDAVPSGLEGTFESFRVMIAPLTGEPRHPSAWGAICNSLIKEGLLIPTDKPHAATVTDTNNGCKRQILRRP